MSHTCSLFLHLEIPGLPACYLLSILGFSSPFLQKWHGILWVVSIYMYIIFRSIGRSTELNIPVYEYGSVQFSSLTQSCLTLCEPVDCSMPGLPVHFQLSEFTQMHVHWVSDAIQPSHPRSSPSPPTSILPSIRVYSNETTLRMKWPKCWSFSFSISPPMITQDLSLSGWTGWISLQSKGLSRVFPNTTVQKHQFLGTQLSSQSNSHIHTWLLEKP